MRENRPYGSEGGEANAFPTPYQHKIYGLTLIMRDSIVYDMGIIIRYYNNVGREKMGKKEIAEKIIKVSGALVRMVIGMGAATLLFLGLRKGRKR